MNTKRKLGQGLSALLEHRDDVPSNEISYLNPEQLKVGLYQPRQHFDEEALQELAASIKEKGILHPLIARTNNETGDIELIAGERRLRAARLAGIREVPCRLLPISKQEALEISLLENIQRTDLSPIEEAKAYEKLMVEMNYTQEELAQKVGKSRAHLANTLRLLRLAPHIQKLVDNKTLSAGHARALLGAQNPEAFAEDVVREGWSVRKTEEMVRTGKVTEQKSDVNRGEAAASHELDLSALHLGNVEAIALAQQVRALTGLKAEVKLKKQGGVISLYFETPDALDRFLSQLHKGQSTLEPKAG